MKIEFQLLKECCCSVCFWVFSTEPLTARTCRTWVLSLIMEASSSKCLNIVCFAVLSPLWFIFKLASPAVHCLWNQAQFILQLKSRIALACQWGKMWSLGTWRERRKQYGAWPRHYTTKNSTRRFQLPVSIKHRSNKTEGLNIVIPFCGQKINGRKSPLLNRRVKLCDRLSKSQERKGMLWLHN